MKLEDMTFDQVVAHNTQAVSEGLSLLATTGRGDTLHTLIYQASERTARWAAMKKEK